MAVEHKEPRPLVFISYTRPDSEFAYRLRADLEASGFSTWIDTAKLGDEGGQEWLRIIQDAIDSCQALVVVVSPVSVQSRYVHMEYHYAQTQDKLVVPLHYQTVSSAPIDLALDEWIDFRADQGREDWYQVGISHLTRSLAKAPTPPHLPELPHPPTQEPLVISADADIPEFAPITTSASEPALAVLELTAGIYAARSKGDLVTEEFFLRQVVDSGDPFASLEFGERLTVVRTEIENERKLHLVHLAQEAAQQEQWRRALGAWQALLDLDPNDVAAQRGAYEARLKRAQEALRDGEFDEAVGAWQALFRSDPTPSHGSGLRHALKARARDAWSKAEWSRAIESWETLRALTPPEPHADDYLSAMSQNRRQDYRYQVAQRLIQIDDLAAAKSALIDLYHAAPYYGDPAGVAEKAGVAVPEELDVVLHRTIELPALDDAHHTDGTDDATPEEARDRVTSEHKSVKRTLTFALASSKGRTGKTATAINLGASLASAQYRVLIVDLSPSAEATTGLGVDPSRVGLSIYELLVNDSVEFVDVVRSDIRPNLSLLPAKVDLYDADIELVYLEHRESRLQRILRQANGEYDFVLIDCPSWLGGLLLVNALTAANAVILVLPCEYFALEGMQQLLNTIRLVRDRLNPNVYLFGLVLTMYDPRTRLAGEVVDEIAQHFPREKFQTIIPRNIRIEEAPLFGLTILEHDPRSPGAQAYKALAEEVAARAAIMTDIHA